MRGIGSIEVGDEGEVPLRCQRAGLGFNPGVVFMKVG
jgi:hypothetical protein